MNEWIMVWRVLFCRKWFSISITRKFDIDGDIYAEGSGVGTSKTSEQRVLVFLYSLLFTKHQFAWDLFEFSFFNNSNNRSNDSNNNDIGCIACKKQRPTKLKFQNKPISRWDFGVEDKWLAPPDAVTFSLLDTHSTLWTLSSVVFFCSTATN